MGKRIKSIASYITCFILMFNILTSNAEMVYAASSYFAGEGSETSPYEISTVEELLQFSSLMNVGDVNYNTKYYKIKNDIDLSGIANWTPISNFNGIFDGNGNRITGLTINSVGVTGETTKYIGLFESNKGTVKNLGVINSNIEVSNYLNIYAGGIAGENNGSIINCYFTGDMKISSAWASSKSSKTIAGGIVGCNNGMVADSYNTGSISARTGNYSGLVYAGGIAGDIYKGIIKNCHNEGSITTSSEHYSYSGGIAGSSFLGTILDSYNKGVVSADGTLSNKYSGGITGDNYRGTITNCYNEGKVSSRDYGHSIYAGGITGSSGEVDIINCNNSGAIELSESGDAKYAGGIAGYIGSNGTISGSYNSGDISVLDAWKAYVGGIVGQINNNEPVTGAYNTGNIFAAATSNAYAGGVAGQINGGIFIECYNIGRVASSSDNNAYTGGFAGNNYGTIENSFNAANVYSSAKSAFTGGLVGVNSSGAAANVYNVGDISSTALDNSYNGGVAGYVEGGNITSAYYLNTNEQGVDNGTVIGATKLSADEMKLESSYRSFNFVDIWEMPAKDSYKYPCLRSVPIDAYIVEYDSQGGSTINSVNVAPNSIIIEPTKPVRPNYIFGGWYKEAGCINKWSFETDKVTSDVKLYAKWTKETGLKVNVSSINGIVLGLLEDYNYKDSVELTAVPNEGFVFLNWSDNLGKVLCNDATYKFEVTDDIQLKANFTSQCDIDKDGEVTILDLATIAKRYNTKSVEVNWNSNFDFNKDNIIDLFDLVYCSKKIIVK